MCPLIMFCCMAPGGGGQAPGGMLLCDAAEAQLFLPLSFSNWSSQGFCNPRRRCQQASLCSQLTFEVYSGSPNPYHADSVLYIVADLALFLPPVSLPSCLLCPITAECIRVLQTQQTTDDKPQSLVSRMVPKRQFYLEASELTAKLSSRRTGREAGGSPQTSTDFWTVFFLLFTPLSWIRESVQGGGICSL